MERGGRITEALERISRSLQENQRLERKLEADTESGRKVVVMLAAFPAVFLGLFYFLNPEGTALLFTTILGQVVLVFVIVMVYAAVRWANRILTSGCVAKSRSHRMDRPKYYSPPAPPPDSATAAARGLDRAPGESATADSGRDVGIRSARDGSTLCRGELHLSLVRAGRR